MTQSLDWAKSTMDQHHEAGFSSAFEVVVFELFAVIIQQLEKCMAGLDDVTAAEAQLSSDVSTQIADVTARIDALAGQVADPAKVQAIVADLNKIDSAVKSSDPGTQPAPAPAPTPAPTPTPDPTPAPTPAPGPGPAPTPPEPTPAPTPAPDPNTGP